MSLTAAKVSAVVATGLICFALGVGAGGMGVVYFGKSLIEDSLPTTTKEGSPAAGPPGRPGGPGGMAARQGGPGGMAGGRGGAGGGRGPNAKTQLATLVTKLDQLTKKPLTVSLTEAQAKKISEQLAGLGEKEDLADDEAKKKLDAILEVVETQKEVLETAGYRWPGQPGAGGFGGGPGGGGRAPGEAPPANPFKDDQNSNHLKSLQEKLSKGSTGKVVSKD